MGKKLAPSAIRAKFPDGFATVIFDCDSTLSAIEGIEELAVSHRAEVSRLTQAAMRGEVTLESVYGRRLDLIKPSKTQVDALGALYVQHIVEDASAVCRELSNAGIAVRIMSGGLLPAVLHLARAAGVPDHNVAAVDVFFETTGQFDGYDTKSPLARSGGKLEMLRSWLPGLTHPIMTVGDGSTDLETAPLVDLFVAYAGVVARDVVVAQAEIVIPSHSLAPIFALAVGGVRAARLTGEGEKLRAKGATTLEEMET